MSRCNWCRATGLIFIRYQQADGYDLAACQCEKGQWWRQPYQLRAKAAMLQPKPQHVGRIEEFYTEAELRVLTTTYERYDSTTRQVVE